MPEPVVVRENLYNARRTLRARAITWDRREELVELVIENRQRRQAYAVGMTREEARALAAALTAASWSPPDA